MADRLFIMARRLMAKAAARSRGGNAMKLVHDAQLVDEKLYRTRAACAQHDVRKHRGICHVVCAGDQGYAWPTRYSEDMADVRPRRFNVA